MANTIAFVIFAIVSTTMTHFSATETNVSVLDITFSIREKTAGKAPTAISNHSTNKTAAWRDGCNGREEKQAGGSGFDYVQAEALRRGQLREIGDAPLVRPRF